MATLDGFRWTLITDIPYWILRHSRFFFFYPLSIKSTPACKTTQSMSCAANYLYWPVKMKVMLCVWIELNIVNWMAHTNLDNWFQRESGVAMLHRDSRAGGTIWSVCRIRRTSHITFPSAPLQQANMQVNANSHLPFWTSSSPSYHMDWPVWLLID